MSREVTVYECSEKQYKLSGRNVDFSGSWDYIKGLKQTKHTHSAAAEVIFASVPELLRDVHCVPVSSLVCQIAVKNVMKFRLA